MNLPRSRSVLRVPPRMVVLTALLAVFATVLGAFLPCAAWADEDAYKQHMDNGVKLYEDQNYEGAVVEFEAAYRERPRASPLINVALCQKKQFKYIKAIATLETALSKHGDSMDSKDRDAAVSAIAEMKRLLGHVRIAVSPPGATVTVDGELVPPASRAEPIPLTPGSHKIAASMTGYASAERDVSVASGTTPTVVTLTLQRLGAPAPTVTGPIGPKSGPPEPKRRTALMVTGIALTGLGLITAVVGVVYIAADRCLTQNCEGGVGSDASADELGAQRTAGIVVTVIGGSMVAVGLPLAIIGARKVPQAPPPRATSPIPLVRVGLDRASVGWSF